MIMNATATVYGLATDTILARSIAAIAAAFELPDTVVLIDDGDIEEMNASITRLAQEVAPFRRRGGLRSVALLYYRLRERRAADLSALFGREHDITHDVRPLITAR